MGIPFYFKSITNKYPYTINRKIPDHVKCLFFDFNSVIHQAAQSAIAMETTSTELHNIIFDQIIKHVQVVVDKVQPEELVYIAVDGLCPMAKMHQQRKRRYMTSWRLDKLNQHHPYWDSNCITPGTKFMNALDAQLTTYATQRSHQVKWVVSGSDIEGEGEHKIFQYIKNNKPDNSVIYGLDADLIMLSMISMERMPESHVTLLRDDLTVDIAALMSSIKKEHCISINNYIFICTLLGNDFLPPLSYLKIKNNDIDTLVTLFSKQLDCQELINSSSATLNIQALHDFISSLTKTEDTCMQEACDLYYKEEKRNTRFLTPEDRIAQYPMLNKFPYVITPARDPAWRLSYYHYLFPSHVEVSDVCDNYIEGLRWIITYYYDYKNASKTWFYRYNVSPTIIDLHNRMTLHMFHVSKKVNNVVHDHALYEAIRGNPDLQLLMVLPPSSCSLLQSPRAVKLMTDMSYGCLHYYPIEFKIMTFLKQYMWECIPLLPDIDPHHLLNQIQQSLKKVD